TTCPTAIALKKISAPPTTNARWRSPRRQAVTVASTKKVTSSTRLSWATKIHGLVTPTGTETLSPPHHESCFRLVVCSYLELGLKPKLRSRAGRRVPQTLHASHNRPARR